MKILVQNMYNFVYNYKVTPPPRLSIFRMMNYKKIYVFDKYVDSYVQDIR